MDELCLSLKRHYAKLMSRVHLHLLAIGLSPSKTPKVGMELRFYRKNLSITYKDSTTIERLQTGQVQR